jgi:hypothetical protein
MLLSGDYNPIVASGTVEKAIGILGRKRVRNTLPRFEQGFAYVFVSYDNEVVSSVSGLSAAEKYWFRGGVWSKVDLRDHDLIFEFPYRPASAKWTFLINVSARVRVARPQEVAQRGLSSVSSYVQHDLGTVVDNALSTRPRIQGKPRPDVTEEQTRIERAVRGVLPLGQERLVGSDGWLGWVPVAVAVSMDELTSQEFTNLRSDDHEAERAERRKRKERKLVKREIKVKEEWSSYYRGKVDNPLDRAVLLLAQNPSEETVARVVDQLNEGDASSRDRVFAFVERQMSQGRLDSEDDAVEMRKVLDAIEGRQQRPDAESIGAGTDGLLIEQRKPARDDFDEAEVGQPSDKDWSQADSPSDRGDR